MKQNQYKEMVIKTVAEPMLSFLAECEDCGYTVGDVAVCRSLLDAYLDALAGMTAPTDEAIMEQVQTVVLALNDLNEKTDYAMIETGEREAIWEIIQSSAVDFGLQEYSEDITEEWREW